MPPRARAAKNISPEIVPPDDPISMLEECVLKCLDAKAIGTDVGRLCKIKELMSNVNWDSQESIKLKSLLVSCFESRIFYKSAQGINFLASVFNVHPLMLAPIDEVLKRCVIGFPDNLLRTCSQVLLKAWQLSSGGMRIALEQRIFEWMRLALFTSTKAAGRVRLLLNEIHTTQRTPEINDLLSRYYGPILLRNTKVPNWEVRFNAIALLCQAFPVMPPDRTQVEFEEKLTIQFRVFRDAIEDPNESVRKCAVSGAGRILRDFWEVLTIEQIAMLLDSIAQKAARDKASVSSRQTAIRSLSFVIDNPLSHGVMNELLKGGFATNLMNDSSPIVRLEFATFLQKISRISTFNIPRFIDNGSLLARIAAEHALALHSAQGSRKTALILTNIIGPSVFSDAGTEAQVERCERLAHALPQVLLSLTANCEEATEETDRLRLAVALSKQAVRLVGRKQPVARILLCASADLMRQTCISSVQGTETVFRTNEDKKQLADFVYRHITDRETDKFIELCLTSHPDMMAEALDWLSYLDGTRLPLVFNRILNSRDAIPSDLKLRISQTWGSLDRDSSKDWKNVASCIRARAGPCDSIDDVIQLIDACLSLKDTEGLKNFAPEMIKTVQELALLLPNVKFLPQVEKLMRCCLSALLMLHAERGSELATILHPVQVGIIQSLTEAPISARPAAKRPKGRSVTEPDDICMSPSEMADFLVFYLSFLLSCSLIANVPLKIVKFDEIATVLFSWIQRSDSPKDSELKRVSNLVKCCIEAQAGATHSFPIIDGIVRIDSHSEMNDLASLIVENFGYSGELNTLVTRMKISGDSSELLQSLSKCIESTSNAPDDLKRLVSAA